MFVRILFFVSACVAVFFIVRIFIINSTENAAGNGREYYISSSGNDAGNGQENTPFKTIQHALNLAKAGDTIVLADGLYEENLRTIKHGNVKAPITVRGSSKAILKATKSHSRIFEINHSYIHLDGFTIDGQITEPAVNMDSYADKLIYIIGVNAHQSTTGIVIENMTLKNAGGECLRIRFFAQKNEIAYNNLSHCGIYDFVFSNGGKNGEGIYIGTAPEQQDNGKNPTGDPDESNNNYIHHNIIATYGNECVDIKENASYNIVESNTCSNQQDLESGGIDVRGNDNTIANNVISNVVGAGIRLGGDGTKDGINNQVINNQIDNVGQAVIKIMRFPQKSICNNKASNYVKLLEFGSEDEKTNNINPLASCN